MKNHIYVVTDDTHYSTNNYTINVPECCKQFFDWLVKRDLVDSENLKMERVTTEDIDFEIKEK